MAAGSGPTPPHPARNARRGPRPGARGPAETRDPPDAPLRDPPAGFGAHRAGPELRSPLEIVGHLGDLLEWAEQLAGGQWVWKAASAGEWEADVERFFAVLARLDVHLAYDAPLGHPAGVIFQGPIADALTHVGQLAMLRRLAGAPVRPESYGRAEIRIGRVGREQSNVRREFDGDASAR